jgi:hypothetical protein
MDNSMKLDISRDIREKLLTKHNVTEEDIIQCFSNDYGLGLLYDDREDHKPIHVHNGSLVKLTLAADLKSLLCLTGIEFVLKQHIPRMLRKSVYTQSSPKERTINQ